MKLLLLLVAGAAALQPWQTTTTTTKRGAAVKKPETVRSFQPFDFTKSGVSQQTLKKKTPAPVKASVFGGSSKKKEDVVVPRDFTLAIVVAAIAAYLDQIPYVQYAFGAPLSAIAVLFFVQTLRISFVFEDKEFGIKDSPAWTGKPGLTDSAENYVIGGANRWKYSTVINYDAFPKWLPFAVLLYFKETQTPKDKWGSNPVGRLANNPSKKVKPGQVHFFPAVCNAKVFKEEFAKRGCPKV